MRTIDLNAPPDRYLADRVVLVELIDRLLSPDLSPLCHVLVAHHVSDVGGRSYTHVERVA